MKTVNAMETGEAPQPAAGTIFSAKINNHSLPSQLRLPIFRAGSNGFKPIKTSLSNFQILNRFGI